MNIQTVFEYSLFDFRVLQQARPLTLQMIENYSQGQMRDQNLSASNSAIFSHYVVQALIMLIVGHRVDLLSGEGHTNGYNTIVTVF